MSITNYPESDNREYLYVMKVSNLEDYNIVSQTTSRHWGFIRDRHDRIKQSYKYIRCNWGYIERTQRWSQRKQFKYVKGWSEQNRPLTGTNIRRHHYSLLHQVQLWLPLHGIWIQLTCSKVSSGLSLTDWFSLRRLQEFSLQIILIINDDECKTYIF